MVEKLEEGSAQGSLKCVCNVDRIMWTGFIHTLVLCVFRENRSSLILEQGIVIKTICNDYLTNTDYHVHSPLQRLIKPLNPLQVTTSWLCIGSIALKHRGNCGRDRERQWPTGTYQLEMCNIFCLGLLRRIFWVGRWSVCGYWSSCRWVTSETLLSSSIVDCHASQIWRSAEVQWNFFFPVFTNLCKGLYIACFLIAFVVSGTVRGWERKNWSTC